MPSGLRHALAILAALMASATAAPLAQNTGALPPAIQQGVPQWSGEDGSSGHPLMTADAIREAAANFHGCLERLWPAAARRGITRQVYTQQTASLTPDLRIMDLMDSQPEFTKSFWDYLDVLVTDRSEERRVGKECRSRWSP